MEKPDLFLYLGKKVTRLHIPKEKVDQPWAWGIELEGNVIIWNKSRDEVFPPTEIVDSTLKSVSLSTRDTTLHFYSAVGILQNVGLKPTQYAISDPVHGGEVYPQWPEELEEAGIPSHPEESVSDPPENTESWFEQRRRYLDEADARRQRAAQEFLQEESNEAKP